MNAIYTLEPVQKGDKSIYLAGPTFRIEEGMERSVSWRIFGAKNILEKINFDGNVYVPEYRDNKKPEEWTYSRQVDWEIQAMENATVILFWIPRDLKVLPAFTTNIEFGEYMKSGKIVIGAPEDAPKNRYLQERCSRFSITWHNKLETCVQEAIKKVEEINVPTPKTWFTADTHFGSERTLQLSKRPYGSVEEMDWDMVKKWNEKISNIDTVYHLGDFGDPNMMKFLNHDYMYFVPGNYDNQDMLNNFDAQGSIEVLYGAEQVCYISVKGQDIRLIHKPEDAIQNWDDFCLFGHIHKLQMVKENGLNVGVDCHNFYPIDEETVLFYKNAIENHYDKNVFMGKMG
jgi:calcineurin-like phosphoesterase family protein